MKPYARADRVGTQIKQLLAEMMYREIKDPRLAQAVITSVKMTKDLKSARVYYAVSGDDPKSRDRAMKAFTTARGYMKRTLAGQLELRYMPDLKFFYDDSFDYGSHIDGILRSLNIDDGPNYKMPESQ